MAERGASVVGVDGASAMIELARERQPGLDFRQADAHALPFEAAAFDAVLGNFVILHLGRPERAVAEFARVIAPGGTVALTVWDRPERASSSPCSSTPSPRRARRRRRTSPADPLLSLRRRRGVRRAARAGRAQERRVETIDFTHGVATADELWDGLLGGAVRTRR